MHWQIDDGGHLILHICPIRPVPRGQARAPRPRCQSPVVLGPGQLGIWTHLATVFDRRAESITHYVNGREVCGEAFAGMPPVEIGWAEIGNWRFPTSDDPYPVRNLNGRIDEFILFNQALGAPEIRAMFEAGRPSS